ncbi:DUF3307 domain-containing protein [Maribacter sp. 2307ULW6-5]|uniref:DUF3307 domain-containing protein n=1 Tax=Maribacter sp. 2307ULW6-5 TaxID=3386275 RepID=UPI0039BCAC91
MLFVKLLLAHLLADFLLQPKKWVLHRESRKIASRYLYLHILVHFALYMIVLWDLGHYGLALVIALSHGAIDTAKSYVQPLFKRDTALFFLDQMLHLAVLYGVAYHQQLPGHLVQGLAVLDWPLVTALFFVTVPAAVIMGKLLEGMSDQIETDHRSLNNAGRYIGILERLFVFMFVVLGQWGGIGLLITAKSVFRFNDLKERNNRKLTEYILIGTLVSFGLAMLSGLLYSHLG